MGDDFKLLLCKAFDKLDPDYVEDPTHQPAASGNLYRGSTVSASCQSGITAKAPESPRQMLLHGL